MCMFVCDTCTGYDILLLFHSDIVEFCIYIEYVRACGILVTGNVKPIIFRICFQEGVPVAF